MMERRTLMRLGLAVALVAAVAAALVFRPDLDAGALETAVRGAGIWAPLAFAALYIAATVLFLPGTLLGLAGGALFGPVWGSIITLLSATVGATLAFLIARYVASDWVARRTGGRLKRLTEGVEAEGWRFVAFVRLVPLFPFNLLNYALGLTRVRLWHYVVASLICMAPGTIAYTYLGYAGREALAGSEGTVRNGLLALGLLALVAFLPWLVRRLRGPKMLTAGDLRARLDAREILTVLDVRGPDEFDGPGGHVTGALNIPVDELATRTAELESGRAVAIVCKIERRSIRAAQILAASGFSDVAVMRGGMDEWNRLWYATGAGSGAPQNAATEPA